MPIWLAYFIAPALLLLFANKAIQNSESPLALQLMAAACGLICAAVLHGYVAIKKKLSVRGNAAEESEIDLVAAHRHSSNHRDEILRSERCVCFCCLREFAPSDITEWIDEIAGTPTTALCPHCGIDSVIGSASGYPFDLEFLRQMNRKWF